jgi:hypothetical protein
MPVVCIGRLMVPRPITALVYRLERALRSNITLGDIIAADCFRPCGSRIANPRPNGRINTTSHNSGIYRILPTL